MKAHNLDALLFPGASGASIAAKPGYPTVIVPFGFVEAGAGPAGRGGASTPVTGAGGRGESAYPEGFNPKPSPFGVSFTAGGLQRAEADRAGLRLRAGDEEAGAAGVLRALRGHRCTWPACSS